MAVSATGASTAPMRGQHAAPARKEPRNGSSKNERETTNGRSRNYGGEHPVRAFRGIGRNSSSLTSATISTRRISRAERDMVRGASGQLFAFARQRFVCRRQSAL